MTNTIVVGIDFGTTNTKACIRESIDNQPNCIEFEPGKNYLPSVVNLNKKTKGCSVGGENGESICYKIEESKRLIGREFKTVKNKEEFPTKLGYNVGNVDGMASIRINSTTDGSNDVEIIDIDPRLVAADILKKVKETIIEKCSEDTTVKAVVTVPANYGFSQKSATLEAAELSGLEVLLLIPEPTAAALAFLHSKKFKDGYYLIIDFGGGTLDLSLVSLEGKKVVVKKVFGDMFLGGADIDQAIADKLKVKIAQQAPDIPLTIIDSFNPITENVNLNNAFIKKKAKFIKEILCGNNCKEETNISINLRGSGSATKTVSLKFSKEEISSILNEKFREPFEKVLKECKKEMRCKLDGILLAGGSSRLPAIETWTKNVFGSQVIIHTDAHQVQTLVARGALLAAESIMNGTNNYLLMEEVTATHLGIESLNLSTKKTEFATLIPIHSKLNTSFSKVFTNTINDQERVEIRVLESFNESLNDSTEISILKFGIVKRKKGTTKLVVTFKIDQNGILQVSVIEQDRESDNQHELTVALTKKWTSEQMNEFRTRKHFSVHEVRLISAERVLTLSQQLSYNFSGQYQEQYDEMEKLFTDPNKILILDTQSAKEQNQDVLDTTRRPHVMVL